jgi:hypothetical protein|tara:strand:+ start:904 stop:1149 length:246 start_codon:yes stop_codon:yes gene_type:complete
MKKLFLFIVIFLIIGGYLIVRNNDIDLEEEEGRKTFLKGFTGWVFKVGRSTKNVVGYATKQEWLPDEEINQTNKTFFIFED